MLVLLKKLSTQKIAIALGVAVAAPLIADYIRKQIKKKEEAAKPKVEANTDHSFVAWTGDDKFFEIEGDTKLNGYNSLHLLPLSSKERMKGYPTFKKYTPFNVSPTKRIKIA